MCASHGSCTDCSGMHTYTYHLYLATHAQHMCCDGSCSLGEVALHTFRHGGCALEIFVHGCSVRLGSFKGCYRRGSYMVCSGQAESNAVDCLACMSPLVMAWGDCCCILWHLCVGQAWDMSTITCLAASTQQVHSDWVRLLLSAFFPAVAFCLFSRRAHHG
jgi:hypothetical protein